MMLHASQKGAYWALCKPKVVALMLLSALVGMLLAPHALQHPQKILCGLLGIALASASGAVVNHLIDRRYDAAMQRTHRRPLPQNLITPKQALYFGALLLLQSMVVLILWVNVMAAWLTLGTMMGYAWVYTHWLKHATPQNIVIGGLSGALPPLLGWTCITPQWSAEPLLLVLLIFVWTPPHFWALAIDRIEDYRQANVPMLPITHGIAYTKQHITLYACLTVMVSYFPIMIGMFGMGYGLGMTLLNARFLSLSWRCQHSSSPHLPKKLFLHSIQYLMLSFFLMLCDHGWQVLHA